MKDHPYNPTYPKLNNWRERAKADYAQAMREKAEFSVYDHAMRSHAALDETDYPHFTSLQRE